MHFDATLASSPNSSPWYPFPQSTKGNSPKTPRWSSLALQHFRTRGPFFFTLPFEKASEKFAFLFRSSVPRVWLPSLRLFSPPSPRKPLSAPNTLGLLPSELSSSPGGRSHVPMKPLRSCTSSKNLTASELCFSVLFPPEKPFPLCSLDDYSRAETLALLGLPASQVSPSQRSRKKASPFLPSPLVLPTSTSLNIEAQNLRVFSPARLGSLPP